MVGLSVDDELRVAPRGELRAAAGDGLELDAVPARIEPVVQRGDVLEEAPPDGLRDVEAGAVAGARAWGCGSTLLPPLAPRWRRL